MHYDGQPASPTGGELAARARVIGQRLFASDEGGESGGLPVRVQWNTGLT